MRHMYVIAAATVALMLTSAASAHAWVMGALVNVSTHRCLRDGPTVHVDVCDGSHSTLWVISGYSNHTYQLRNVNTGRCLDDSDKGLRTYGCQPDKGQYQDFQSWMPSGMVAGNPWIDRYQNMATKNCLYDGRSGHVPRMVKCVQHTDAAWANQAWRWSYRANG
jgi:hypothetical protein